MSDIAKIEHQAFDTGDSKNAGRPRYFNIDQYLCVVEQMVISDEVERALWMLDNMPGWYRDNYPPEAKSLKELILKKLYTTIDYSEYISHANQSEILLAYSKDEINSAIMNYLHRAQLLMMFCQDLNERDIAPHIVEIAPGSYWLPIGLKKNNIKFTYFGQGLHSPQEANIKAYMGNDWAIRPEAKKSIFVCYELIEHLHSPDEIYQDYLKQEIKFDYIFLSTPKYCVFGGNPEWKTGEVGHLRAYTPNEFYRFAQKNWPDFTWVMYDAEVMVLRGERKNASS